MVDTLGLLLVVAATCARVQDRAGGRAVLSVLAHRLPTVALVWADGGYAHQVDASLLSWARQTLRLVIEIVQRSDDVTGFQVLPRRRLPEIWWETTLGWLVRNRRLARDDERLTVNSETMVKIAMIRLIANRFAGQQIRWSNHTEREAARRLTAETLTAA